MTRTLLTILTIGLHTATAQHGLHTAGGTATGQGSVTYSIGQVVYTHHAGLGGSAAEGVQHPVTASLPTAVVSTGVQALTAWPNPTRADVTLTRPVAWVLHDHSGKVVARGRGQRITMAGLPAGCYTLRTDYGNIIIIKQ